MSLPFVFIQGPNPFIDMQRCLQPAHREEAKKMNVKIAMM